MPNTNELKNAALTYAELGYRVFPCAPGRKTPITQHGCLDATTGERIWETRQPTGEGRWWNAFLIPHEPAETALQQSVHRVFIHNEQGDLILASLSPEGYDEISRSKLVEPTRRLRRRYIVWSHPAFAMRSVFARNDQELVRVDLSQ